MSSFGVVCEKRAVPLRHSNLLHCFAFFAPFLFLYVLVCDPYFITGPRGRRQGGSFIFSLLAFGVLSFGFVFIFLCAARGFFRFSFIEVPDGVQHD